MKLKSRLRGVIRAGGQSWRLQGGARKQSCKGVQAIYK